jgi:hypothetical protein
MGRKIEILSIIVMLAVICCILVLLVLSGTAYSVSGGANGRYALSLIHNNSPVREFNNVVAIR